MPYHFFKNNISLPQFEKYLLLCMYLAWWTKTLLIRRSKRLSIIQWLVYLSVTGAMQTNSTAALELFLDLPILHLQIQKATPDAKSKLLQGEGPNKQTARCQILCSALQKNPILWIPVNDMYSKYDFKLNVRPNLRDKKACLNGPPIKTNSFKTVHSTELKEEQQPQ